MFHLKVMASLEAILKNEVAVCWGWAMERMGGKGAWELLLLCLI